MKRLIILFITAALVLIGGCGAKTVTTPFGAEEKLGKSYESAASELMKAGFTNVNTEPVNTKHADIAGNVESIKIDGKTNFKKNDSFPEKANVVIKYYRLIDKQSGNSGISFFK